MLYVVADVHAFLLFHLVRYRRKVVHLNMRRAFPDKSKREIRCMEKRFYRNFCDSAFEMCKLLKMDVEDIQKRVKFTNPERIRALYEEGRSLFYALPHSGNWEWFGKLMHRLSEHKCVAVYKRIQNEYFEDFMYRMRTSGKQEDDQMVESGAAFRTLLKRSDMRNAVLIVADQSPRGLATDYWTDFLNQDTCWFTGTEKMSRMLDYSVVFVAMRRVGRGYYEVTFEDICVDPGEVAENGITERYVRCLERFIRANPDNWLWSHRRWKHTRKSEEKTDQAIQAKRTHEEVTA